MPDSIKVPFNIYQNRNNLHGNFSIIKNELILDPNNPWSKTWKNVRGIPADWVNIGYGSLTLDLFQNTYQEYIIGNIDESFFKFLEESWKMNIDDDFYSKKPLKSRVYIAWGFNASNEWKFRVDTNYNLDFSDDAEYDLPKMNEKRNNFSHSVSIPFEDFIYKQVMDKQTSYKFALDPSETLYYQGNYHARGILPYTNDSFIYRSSRADFMAGDLYFLKDTFDGGSVNIFEALEKEFYYNFNDTPYIYKGVTKDHANLLFVKLKGNADAIYSNQKGYKMRPITGQDFLTNKEINTEHLDSKYLLVNFWGSWCVGCMQDKPYMIEAYNKLDPKKVKFLGIAADNSYKLSELLKGGDMPWPQILNTSENNIVEKNNIQGFPTNLLIDKNDVIISNHIRGEKFYDEIIKSINAHEKKLSK